MTMNEPRCIAQLLRNESPNPINFTITHGRDVGASLSAPVSLAFWPLLLSAL